MAAVLGMAKTLIKLFFNEWFGEKVKTRAIQTGGNAYTRQIVYRINQLTSKAVKSINPCPWLCSMPKIQLETLIKNGVDPETAELIVPILNKTDRTETEKALIKEAYRQIWSQKTTPPEPVHSPIALC